MKGNSIKCLIMSLIIIVIPPSLNSIERRSRGTTLKQLTTRDSIYYVPVAFPKTKKEITKNLIQYFKKQTGGAIRLVKGMDSSHRKVGLKFVQGMIGVTRIIKAVNYCAGYEYKHTYIIEIGDNLNKLNTVCVMPDDGRVLMIAGASLKGDIPSHPSEKEIFSELEKCNIRIDHSYIKKLEWIDSRSISGVYKLPLRPAQKLTLRNGKIFYKINKIIYKVFKIHKLKNDPSNFRAFREFEEKNPHLVLVDNSVFNYIEELFPL